MGNKANKHNRKNKLEKARDAKRIKAKIRQEKRFKGVDSISSAPVEKVKLTKIGLPAVIMAGVFLLFAIVFYFSQDKEKVVYCNSNDSLKMSYSYLSDPYSQYSNKVLNKPVVTEFEKQINSIVGNAPMKVMVKDIVKRDRAVAAFIVGIAMKESKFGKFSPKKDGAECYNYWGYRGKENTTKSGYSCFDNPRHAIKVVGDRIESIVDRGAKTPAQMISWKCGSTCAGHSKESVDKWIQDVSIHYFELNPKEIAKK